MPPAAEVEAVLAALMTHGWLREGAVAVGREQRVEVGLREPQQLPPAGDPALDEVDEARARRRGDLHARERRRAGRLHR